MLDLTKPALSNALRLAVVVVTLAVAGWVGYDIGHTQATREGHTLLAQQAAKYEKTLKEQAEVKASELATALTEQNRLQQQAQQLGMVLLQTRSQLVSTQLKLKQRIDDATRSDGEHFTGIGPDSLRIYRTALGYPERDQGVPTTDAGNAGQAGQTASSEAGLPPADLLEHAADYGQWCQQLDAQLNAYLQLHAQEAHP